MNSKKFFNINNVMNLRWLTSFIKLNIDWVIPKPRGMNLASIFQLSFAVTHCHLMCHSSVFLQMICNVCKPILYSALVCHFQADFIFPFSFAFIITENDPRNDKYKNGYISHNHKIFFITRCLPLFLSLIICSMFFWTIYFFNRKKTDQEITPFLGLMLGLLMFSRLNFA